MERVKIIKVNKKVYIYYSRKNKTIRINTDIYWTDKDKHADIINIIKTAISEIVYNYFEKCLELPSSEYVKNAYEKYKEDKKKEYEKEKRIKYERSLDRRKRHYDKNKDEIIKKAIKRREERRKSDPVFRSLCNLRSSIRASLSKKGYTKKSKTYEILGCSFEDFKKHIESQWEEWMNWDNYGLYDGNYQHGWDFDHITPISKALTEEDVIELNHHTNFQPLCSKENRDDKRSNENYRDF